MGAEVSGAVVDPRDLTDAQIVWQIHKLGPRWARRVSADFGDISTAMSDVFTAIDRAGKAKAQTADHVAWIAAILFALDGVSEPLCVEGEPFQTIPPNLQGNADAWRDLRDGITDLVMGFVAARRPYLRDPFDQPIFNDARPERAALEIVFETMRDLVEHLDATDGFLAPAVFRLNIPADVAP